MVGEVARLAVGGVMKVSVTCRLGLPWPGWGGPVLVVGGVGDLQQGPARECLRCRRPSPPTEPRGGRWWVGSYFSPRSSQWKPLSQVLHQ